MNTQAATSGRASVIHLELASEMLVVCTVKISVISCIKLKLESGVGDSISYAPAYFWVAGMGRLSNPWIFYDHFFFQRFS